MPRELVTKWMLGTAWFACCCFTLVHSIRVEDGILVFQHQPNEIKPLQTWECPRHCEDLFGKLKENWNSEINVGNIQEVYISQRGEPKSGTGFMMGRVTEAFAHFCHYLQKAYGHESCRVEMPTGVIRALVFEPQLVISDGTAPCSCDSIDRVTINFSATTKHSLPVDREGCPWSHSGGMMQPQNTVCKPPGGGRLPKNREALWDCIRSTPCPITDDSLQMAVLRDPRDVALSSFYFLVRRHPDKLNRYKSMDDFYLAFLPTLCKWSSVRFLLFEVILKTQSSVFWYDDAVYNPRVWYSQFYCFAGLNAPLTLLEETIHAHDEGGLDLGLQLQNLDSHPNGTASRSYKDEVSAHVVNITDDILRQWLPPAFLDRIGVFYN